MAISGRTKQFFNYPLDFLFTMKKADKRQSTAAKGSMFSVVSLLFLSIGVLVGLFYSNGKPFPKSEATSIFDFTVDSGSDESVALSSYKGKKAYLVVNVASKCGLTNQNYAELTAIYEKYRFVSIF
jgi:hypothetical protein